MEQQLEELKNATTVNNGTSAEPVINKKKKKKKKNKKEQDRAEEEFYEENDEDFQSLDEVGETVPVNPYGQWESVQKPYKIYISTF